MSDMCRVSEDLKNRQREQEQPSAALPDQIKALAAEKVADEIATRGPLYQEAMAGEGLDQGEEAELSGVIWAAYNAEGGVRDILCADVGKLILKHLEKYIMPTALEQAETELS